MGIEALSASLRSSALSALSSNDPASTAGSAQTERAMPADIARFNAVLSAPAAAQASPQGQGAAVAPPATPGDAILQSLQRRADAIQKDWTMARDLLSQGPISTTHLMRVQYAVLSASVQYDLVGKGISKASQDLDQLLRTQ